MGITSNRFIVQLILIPDIVSIFVSNFIKYIFICFDIIEVQTNKIIFIFNSDENISIEYTKNPFKYEKYFKENLVRKQIIYQTSI